VFRYLLRLSDDEPHDPPAYPDGQQLRIVVIDWDIPQELRDEGFTAIFFVEPL